ncbi:ferric reductase transmembrane component 1 [Staphylotrichum tortipilum]|uniref:Ferric reductase transmembrane component 1 n=1 Tax=Staphylotrichum tortipilum TaxID=2831512 RepID=A0AAN6MFT9_9PEZI|nr:ferric reductase transmembrane component 1 [Staphylotrichum longicolle]
MDRTEACLRAQGALRNTLPAFLRSLCPTGLSALGGESDDDLDWMNDPEKLEYIWKLLDALYKSRKIVSCYNVVVLAAVLVMAIRHWGETRSDERKWRRLVQLSSGGVDGSTPSSSLASSSSSTVAGTVTPLDTKDLDYERAPLLPRNTASTRPHRGTALRRAVRSWLAHQPPPVPIINKTLSSNGTSLFILSWLALNVFFLLFLLPLHWDYFFIFADRTGCLFVVNLPLLYLLSAKNQPIRHLTGYSYEALNIFHRRVGELLCLTALVHFLSMLAWQFLIAADWLRAPSTRAYFTHPLVLCGLGALLSYELLFFTSLASFRRRWYELFLATHILLQTAALAFLWCHYPTARPYAALALLILLLDRLVWRLGLNRADLTADLRVLDAHTCLLSANWSIPQQQTPSRWWSRRSILHGWSPADHVFLTVPTLGPSHTLQAHPFTIASAAPPSPTTLPNDHENAPYAWLNLLIRAHDGFTRSLLHHAHSHSRVAVRLDGPYGSPHALGVLRAAGCAVLVAGGSGVAVVFPLVWALLHEGQVEGGEDGGDGKVVNGVNSDTRRRRGRRTVHLLWVTHAREHREWVPSAQWQELVDRGLELVVPEPTGKAGRPDVQGLVRGWVEGAAAEGREVGVVVSGPDALNRTVRNVCAEEIGKGREVRVAVEKFGW